MQYLQSSLGSLAIRSASGVIEVNHLLQVLPVESQLHIVEESAVGLLVDERKYPDIEPHPDMRTAGEVVFDMVVVLCDELRDMLENAELHSIPRK